MAQMHFARGGLDRKRRIGEKIVRAVHSALRRRLLVLLDCHMETPSSSSRRSVPAARCVPRHHRQGQDHFVLDKLPDVHASGREHAVYIVVGFRDLAQAPGKLQFGVNHDRDRERIEAALAR